MESHVLARPVAGESGLELRFGQLGNARALLTSGWAADEVGFAWMIGMESGIVVPSLPTDAPIILRLSLFPHTNPPLLPSQSLAIFANGQSVFTGTIDGTGEVRCRISAEIMGMAAPLELRFVHPNGMPPSSLAPSPDDRALAIAIRRMSIAVERPKVAWRAPSLEALGLPSRIDFAFTDDAIIAEGVAANFKGRADYIQVSMLMKTAQFSAMGQYFGQRRLSDLGQDPAYFPIGIWASPHAWQGHDGGPVLADILPELGAIFAAHSGLKLLLDYSPEAGLGADFLPALDAVIATLSVDPARIVVLISNLGVAARHIAHRADGTRPAYTIIGFDMPLAFSAVEFARHRWYAPGNTLISPTEIATRSGTVRSHKILTLNRRPRWHRLMLAMMLEQLKLRGDTIASMPSLAFAGDWHPETVGLDNNLATLPAPLRAALEAVRDSTFASLPWVLDVNLDTTGRNAEFAYDQQLRAPYLQSYISVVTESYFEGVAGDVFITEKTCKAIAGMQPFLLFGQSGTLAALRGHGFETQTPFGAGYDDEPAQAARLVKLHQGLSDIAATPIGDIHTLYHDMLPLLRHNFELLFDIPRKLAGPLHQRLLGLLES